MELVCLTRPFSEVHDSKRIYYNLFLIAMTRDLRPTCALNCTPTCALTCFPGASTLATVVGSDQVIR